MATTTKALNTQNAKITRMMELLPSDRNIRRDANGVTHLTAPSTGSLIAQIPAGQIRTIGCHRTGAEMDLIANEAELTCSDCREVALFWAKIWK